MAASVGPFEKSKDKEGNPARSLFEFCGYYKTLFFYYKRYQKNCEGTDKCEAFSRGSLNRVNGLIALKNRIPGCTSSSRKEDYALISILSTSL